jgi:hypothetical protein
MQARRTWAARAGWRRLTVTVGAVLAFAAIGCGGSVPTTAAPAASASDYVLRRTASGAVHVPAPPAEAPLAAAAPPPSPPAGGASSGGAARPTAPKAVADAPHSAAMLIYTAVLTMAVFQVTEGMDAVERVAREAGGYLATRADNAITIRVPRDAFDAAVGRIEKLGDVVHRDIKAEDVTDQYVDLEARLKNAYAMRAQLMELLRRANVKEALEIETELGRITESIEVMEGKLKLLRDQIAFSTITVQFAPIAEQNVHDTSLLAPFPWMQQLGLEKLLDLPQ